MELRDSCKKSDTVLSTCTLWVRFFQIYPFGQVHLTSLDELGPNQLLGCLDEFLLCLSKKPLVSVPLSIYWDTHRKDPGLAWLLAAGR